MREGKIQVSPSYPEEVVQRIVRQNFGRFRQCYEAGLHKNPALNGTVTVAFDIGGGGAVASPVDRGSAMKDKFVTACVVRSFDKLSFPRLEKAVVHVVYPITFEPPDP